ncbi:MAG: polyphosphate:AMP phosphotransferase, partial [Polyangiales bacterium]
MFESAELGHTIDKKTFDTEEPKLRRALLDAQHRVLAAAKFPVVLVIGGVDGAGKGETVNVLNEWMDARHIEAHAITEPSDEERERPHMWRFWRELPPKGKLGIFFGSWYTQPIVDRVYGTTKDGDIDRRLDEIVSFEKMLTDEGVLLLKFWFHLSKKAQKKRLHELEDDKKTSWRVTKADWEHFDRYDKFRRVSEHALRETSRNAATWLVIEGTDDRYRELTAGKTLLDAMNQRLGALDAKPKKVAEKGKSKGKAAATAKSVDVLPQVAAIDHKRVVDTIDLTKKIDAEEYDDLLD